MAKPLMPKATAVWLVENTALTFDQIADFCGLHTLEVKGIADGDVAQGIKGMDPVANGQLARDDIEKAAADPSYRLTLSQKRVQVPTPKRKGPRYTPVSRRQDRPDAIMWLLRHHPEMTDAQVCKLIGTTKPTIQAVRDRSHWNSANLKPVDPVTLGLCSQLDLDAAVTKAADRRAKMGKPVAAPDDETLRPIDETLGITSNEAPAADPFQKQGEVAADGPGPVEHEVEQAPRPEDVFGDNIKI